MDAGLALSEALRKYAMFSHAGKRTIDLASSALLLDAGGDDQKLTQLSLSSVVNFAALHTISIGKVLAMAQPLADLGMAIPELGGKALDVVPTSDLCELFSPDTVVNPQGANEITLGTLVFAAGTWRKSLRHVLEMAQPLALVGFSLPAVPDAALDFVPDAELFSFSTIWRFGSKSAALLGVFESGVVSVTTLVSASRQAGYTLANTLELLRPLVDLGIRLPALSGPALALLSADEVCEDLFNLRFDEDHAQQQSTDQITLSQLAVAAGSAEMSFGELLARALPLAEFGVLLPELPGGMHRMQLGEPLLQLVSRDLDSIGPWRRSPSLVQCVRVAAAWEMSVAELLGMGEQLVAMDFILPKISPEKAEFRPNEEVAHFLRICGGIHSVRGDLLTWRQLTGYSDQFRVDYGSLSQLVAPLRGLGIAVELPRAAGFPLLQVLSQAEGRGGFYSACDLAVYCDRTQLDPALQIDGLSALAEMGWDVEEALAFAHFCASHGE
jgi:hypothetical protein